MPAALVTIEEFRDHLGITGTSEDGVLVPILEDVERTFLQETGRTAAPFSAALTGRVESLKGTGCERIHLDYPIADVTAIVLGFDTGNPDETLDPDDKTTVIWTVGGQSLIRIDGGRFGWFGAPAYVHVTYNTQADLPRDAARAIVSVAATLYRQRGSEDVTQETIGGQQWSQRKPFSENEDWVRAVDNNRRFAV